VVGIDIQPTERPRQHCDSRVHILQGDVTKVSPALLSQHLPPEAGGQYGAILSDMAPSTTGAASRDALRSVALSRCAARLALNGRPPLLAPGGNMVVKVLEGEGFHEFVTDLRQFFVKVLRMRPHATRQESRELYVVCLGSKAAEQRPNQPFE